ncbi:MAG: SDR family oxidoreductase [Microbacteriaceae bacterium]
MSARIAVVTGGNRGLGAAAARALAARGIRVVIASRGPADAVVEAISASGGEALALPLDVAAIDTFAEFAVSLRSAIAARWGAERIDVLVNNAGIGRFAPLEAITAEDFDASIAANVRGPLFLIQALVPMMGDGGRVIDVTTSMTRHVSPATSVYAASKAALEALGRSLASELGPRGIRIVSVAPGPTATDFNGGAMRDDDGLRGVLAERTALGRAGLPEEIGDAIAAIASDDLRWLTAERIEVSGGAFL